MLGGGSGFRGLNFSPLSHRTHNCRPIPKSRLKTAGKTPGKYLAHDVKKADGTIIRAGWVGLGGKWSIELHAEQNHIKLWERWGADVGLQTRIYIAIDIDVDDEQMAAAIEGEFKRVFGGLPVRYRDGSSRRLMLTCIADGEPKLRKRRLKFRISRKEHVVERLSVGQQ